MSKTRKSAFVRRASRALAAIAGAALICTVGWRLIEEEFYEAESGTARPSKDKEFEKFLISNFTTERPLADLAPASKWKLACFDRLDSTLISERARALIQSDQTFQRY